jgi:hypothetical protein
MKVGNQSKRSPRNPGRLTIVLVKLTFLGSLLAATYLFHASGTALVALHLARIALVAGFLLVSRRIARRRERRRTSVPD